MKAEDILRIGELFTRLGWPTEPDFSRSVPDVFERFCKMCSRLSVEQRELVITLTEKYLWLLRGEENERFLRAWNLMVAALPPSIKTVAVLPLLKPKSKHPKSSDAIFYMATGLEANLRLSLGPTRSLIFCKTYAEFGNRYAGVGTALVLVDDYVGTGDTAKKALLFIKDKYPAARNSSSVIVALVAQKAARTSLEETAHCLLFVDLELTRGISDNVTLGDIPAAIEIMNKLGARLQIKKTERLGYGQTEALVTLTRTPNNTFPVYWTNKKVNGIIWDSPFTRYTNYARRSRTSKDPGSS